MEVSRRITRLAYQESGATRKMIRKGLRLITHSWAIWGPRERFRESMNSGRCRAREVTVHPVHDEIGQHVPELLEHRPEYRNNENKGEQPDVEDFPGRVDHHLPDAGGSIGPGIDFPVREQPQQVQIDQHGTAIEDHGPGVAVEKMRQRRAQEGADVDHHIEKTPAHPGGLIRQGLDKGSLNGRLEDRGARGQQQTSGEERPKSHAGWPS